MMDGLAIKVKTADGNESVYKLTPRIIVKPFGPEYLDTILNAELDADPNSESTATV